MEQLIYLSLFLAVLCVQAYLSHTLLVKTSCILCKWLMLVKQDGLYDGRLWYVTLDSMTCKNSPSPIHERETPLCWRNAGVVPNLNQNSAPTPSVHHYNPDQCSMRECQDSRKSAWCAVITLFSMNHCHSQVWLENVKSYKVSHPCSVFVMDVDGSITDLSDIILFIYSLNCVGYNMTETLWS